MPKTGTPVNKMIRRLLAWYLSMRRNTDSLNRLQKKKLAEAQRGHEIMTRVLTKSMSGEVKQQADLVLEVFENDRVKS